MAAGKIVRLILVVTVLGASVAVTVEPQGLWIALPPFLLALAALPFVGRKRKRR